VSKVRPRIADVQCSRLKFEAGDRVLVRTYHTLSRDEERKLRKSIQRWAGVEVEVLIYNANQMEIEVDKPTIPRIDKPVNLTRS
jgi:hypothetical protein